MPIDTTKTGAAIAAHRQRMNLSQQGLAGLMNVTHQAVSKWEKGLALPDTETLLALAKLFGTTMEKILTGKLPKEAEPTGEKIAPVQEITEEEPSASIPADELKDMDFKSIMNMLPFVSTKVVDHLCQTYISSNTPDARQLGAIAPFISTRALNEYIIAHPLKNLTPEIISTLAPFLPTQTVDNMILDLKDPIPTRVMQMLMPFASTRVIDQMVLGKLGIKTEPSANQSQAPNQRESPRTRIIRKAIEHDRYELIEDAFDELDDKAYSMLFARLKETGDAKLMELFCENAGELCNSLQFDLAQLLMDGSLYNQLAEVIEELDEDVQHQVLDKAFEINDPELMHIISEHL